MRKYLKELLSVKNLLVFAGMLLFAWLIGADAESGITLAVAAATVAPDGGGVVVPGAVNTVQLAREEGGDLILNDIERKVLKIRPQSTPLLTIGMNANKRSSKSVIHEYYTVDVLPSSTKVKTAVAADDSEQISLDTDNNKIFSVYETILLKGINGYQEGGVTVEGELVLYITGKASDGKLECVPVNGVKGTTDTTKLNTVPAIAADTEIIRMGRAHNELGLQTSKYAVLPTKKQCFLQTFRTQIEESTLEKMVDKEADWNFSDLEEEAVFDMKRGMNNTFWKGAKRKIQNGDGEDVYFTGGVWSQAGKEFVYGTSSTNLQLSNDDLIDLSKMAFTGTNSSGSKTFIVGSDLMANLSKIDVDKQIVGESTKTKWGITFKIIETNFGNLELIHDESLDSLNMAKCGLIVDANFLHKVVLKEMSAFDFDKRKSGISDVDARAITEISAFILKNPQAHVRVVPTTAA